MNRYRVLASIALGAGAGLLLTACSVDTLIWGADGAHVIATTDQVVQDVLAGDPGSRTCADSQTDFREPKRWEGLSAGEPERITGEFWDDQQALGATWTINLEGLDTTTAENGGQYPSYVFYSEVDDDLCVIDVEWGTVTW